MKEKKRVLIVACTTFSLFALLMVHYFKIQIVERKRWTKAALCQHEFLVTTPARRGTFYSNTTLQKGNHESSVPFVFDVTKFHLFVDPLSIKPAHRASVATALFSLLSLTDKESQVAITAALEKKSRSRRLALWLDRSKKEEIERFWRPFAKKHKIPSNALYFVTDYKRSYPFGRLLGQTLHTIRDLKDETTQEGIPTGGLEAYFHSVLKGKSGKRTLLRSPLHSLEIDKVIKNPEDGADIYLTVNHYIQAIAEEALEKGVQRAHAKGGWAVMMDPYTGEILALAQYPFFEPEHYSQFFSSPENAENAKVKALTDAFEVGSIMKPITTAVALMASAEIEKSGEPPLLTASEKVDTSRSIFPGRSSKPLKDRTFHSYLNMYMAIQKSSNVYVAQIIDRVIKAKGNDWYRKTLIETFGFGQKTDLELPGEATGLMPTPGKLHPSGALEWSVPTPYSLAMGHNILATSVQMLRAYGVLANGGILVKPTLIRKIVKEEKEGREIVIVDHTKKERIASFPKVLNRSIAREVVKAMKYTTKSGGTACRATLAGYSEAGKTGTAEKIIDGSYCKKRHISSFIGLAPASLKENVRTRFVLIVTIDDPEFRILEGGVRSHLGGWCAAPIFQEIAKQTLEYMGVDSDDPFGYPVGDPRCNLEKADWVQEVNELKRLYAEWNKKA